MQAEQTGILPESPPASAQQPKAQSLPYSLATRPPPCPLLCEASGFFHCRPPWQASSSHTQSPVPSWGKPGWGFGLAEAVVNVGLQSIVAEARLEGGPGALCLAPRATGACWVSCSTVKFQAPPCHPPFRAKHHFLSDWSNGSNFTKGSPRVMRNKLSV